MNAEGMSRKVLRSFTLVSSKESILALLYRQLSTVIR